MRPSPLGGIGKPVIELSNPDLIRYSNIAWQRLGNMNSVNRDAFGDPPCQIFTRVLCYSARVR